MLFHSINPILSRVLAEMCEDPARSTSPPYRFKNPWKERDAGVFMGEPGRNVPTSVRDSSVIQYRCMVTFRTAVVLIAVCGFASRAALGADPTANVRFSVIR